ncbi:MAG: PhzF family phenazine biosynthesis protein, partial [Elusimicrobiota bacterium]
MLTRGPTMNRDFRRTRGSPELAAHRRPVPGQEGAVKGWDFLQVDAFTAHVFRGNPAAVFLLPAPRSASWMGEVAAEMNLSETAFLRPRGAGYDLRWFTPKVEVPLCGHGTLASAHALWELGLAGKGEALRFHTKSGLLLARRRGDWIELDFPAVPQRRVREPAGLAAALGARPRHVGRGPGTLLVELGSEKALRRLQPDFKALAAVG